MTRWLFVLLFSAIPLAAADKKTPPWEKPLQKGCYLYLQNCSVCHEINKAETKKIGPTMFRFYQNEKMPFSGGKPSEEFFKVKVMFGGDVMPPFVNRLSEEEIKLLSDFVLTKK